MVINKDEITNCVIEDLDYINVYTLYKLRELFRTMPLRYKCYCIKKRITNLFVESCKMVGII